MTSHPTTQCQNRWNRCSWYAKCVVDNVERVLPLWLRGEALPVYLRLTRDQREDLLQVKQALLMAFAADPFLAFDTFVSRRLRPGETVDKYCGPSTSNRRKHL